MQASSDAPTIAPARIGGGAQMAWLLRGVLCLALIAVITLGIWLDPHVLPTRYHLCGLLLAAVFVLALQPSAIAVAFLSARVAGGALEPAEKLGVGAAVRMFDREIDASLRGLVWANPFAFSKKAPAPAGVPRSTALLFVHGYFCNRGVWQSAMRAAAARGYLCEALTLEPAFGSIDLYRDDLAGAIRTLAGQAGIADVVVVAHSMGALAVRSLLEHQDMPEVRKLICLGAPHHGTLTAAFGHARNTQQMRRDSLWLTHLNGSARFPRARIVSIYSVHDDIVFPWHTSHLEGADNRRLAGIGHVSLLYHPTVQALIFASVEG